MSAVDVTTNDLNADFEDVYMARDFAGLTPKTLRSNQIVDENAKQRGVTDIFGRRRKNSTSRRVSLVKSAFRKEDKIDAKLLKKISLRGRQPHSTVVLKPVEPQVKEVAVDASCCVKELERKRDQSRRVTISSHVDVHDDVTTPWSRIRTTWGRSMTSSVQRNSPAMRTDAGHTPLRQSHRRRRESVFNERLI